VYTNRNFRTKIDKKLRNEIERTIQKQTNVEKLKDRIHINRGTIVQNHRVS
jgi:hypothetical protein